MPSSTLFEFLPPHHPFRLIHEFCIDSEQRLSGSPPVVIDDIQNDVSMLALGNKPELG